MDFYTTNTLARKVGVSPWQVRRAIQRGFMAEPVRIGAYRVFLAADLPAIEAALERAGYLTSNNSGEAK